jgi:succinyl-CoA synthetase alpha subunit
MLGQIPEAALPPGDVALLTDCGSLGAEAGLRISAEGLGLSLFVDFGDGPAKSTHIAGLLEPAAADPDTRALVLLATGIGLQDEGFLSSIQTFTKRKPVLAYVPRRPAQSVSHATGPAPADPAALAAAGATLYNSLGALVAALKASG